MTRPEVDSDAAFAEFVATRSQALLRTACLLTGDWALAEDLLQTALARTYLRWGGIERPGAAEAYVRKVLVTTATTWWRRKWRGEVPTGELPERGAVEGAAQRSDDRAALRAALAELPAKQRAAIVLRYYEDLPDAEVARLLGCSVQTVRSQVSRALVKLRRSPDLADYLPAAAAVTEEEGR